MKPTCLVWGLSLVLLLTAASCATTDTTGTTARQVLAPTALDTYVHEPDDAFSYELESTIAGEGVTMYVLDMTSQTWRDPGEVDRTRWEHWVSIYVPETVRHDTALLYIGGGKNGDPPPSEMAPQFARIAGHTASIVVHLGMVPNQPLVFAGDGERRSEDAMIAYTWDKFLHTGDENWPARLPMTKSAVRAMDAAQAFCATEEAGSHTINDFVVAGGSKRGWTTWTTAAVDRRVIAIVPIVIDMLNVEASFAHHWEVYGFWAPAVGDYEEMGLMDWMGTPEYEALLELVEPYSYVERYTMPKFIMNSGGDQFFLPDSSQFYWDDLIGDKYLRYVPNTGHGLDGSDAILTLMAFHHSIITGTPLPDYQWKIEDGKTLAVTTTGDPIEVRYWSATNPETRDFRVDEVGQIWESNVLEPGADGRYIATLKTPEQGWTAQMVELTFAGPGGMPLKYTTAVHVLPERTPFEYTPPADTPKGFLSR